MTPSSSRPGINKRPDMRVLGPSSGTRPEVILHSFLRSLRIRFIPNDRSKPGSPDAYLPRHRIAIFTDGRFWHDPTFARLKAKPHHRTDFFAKAVRNRRRDRKQNAQLKAMRIAVIRIWDTSLTGKARTRRTLDRLRSAVLDDRRPARIIRL